MSWSISFKDKPEQVVEMLKGHSSNLSDYSKTEYDAALPHLIGLVQQNFNKKPTEALLTINANGHGYAADGEDVYRTLSVTIQGAY